MCVCVCVCVSRILQTNWLIVSSVWLMGKRNMTPPSLCTSTQVLRCCYPSFLPSSHKCVMSSYCRFFYHMRVTAVFYQAYKYHKAMTCLVLLVELIKLYSVAILHLMTTRQSHMGIALQGGGGALTFGKHVQFFGRFMFKRMIYIS